MVQPPWSVGGIELIGPPLNFNWVAALFYWPPGPYSLYVTPSSVMEAILPPLRVTETAATVLPS